MGFLEEVENVLRNQEGGGPDFRLCDYFDLIGGTSAGATIAAGLALGFSVADLLETYRILAKDAFEGSRWHGGILSPKFKGENVDRIIRKMIGHRRLGSDEVRTGLAIAAKRIDTGSPWVFHNNPRSKYFDPPEDDPGAFANRDYEIAQILRASTAAPTYFEPEEIQVTEEFRGLFVDGGVSPYNNPALLLATMATSKAYGYGWPSGPENLSIFSVGTGIYTPQHTVTSFLRLPSSLQAIHALESMITDTMWQAQAILQWLGTSQNPWEIDSEAGTLANELPAAPPLFKYERFDIKLDREWLRSNIGADVTQKELEVLAQLDRPEMVDRLLGLARQAARQQVHANLF